MDMKVKAELLHTCDNVLIKDGNTLLLGGDRLHLNPDGEDFAIRDYPAEKSEVEPLQGRHVVARGPGPKAWTPP